MLYFDKPLEDGAMRLVRVHVNGQSAIVTGRELMDAALQDHSSQRRYLMSTPCWEHDCACDGVGCAFTSACPRRAYWHEGEVCTDSPHYMMSEGRALSRVLDNPRGDVARAVARADSSHS